MKKLNIQDQAGDRYGWTSSFDPDNVVLNPGDPPLFQVTHHQLQDDMRATTCLTSSCQLWTKGSYNFERPPHTHITCVSEGAPPPSHHLDVHESHLLLSSLFQPIFKIPSTNNSSSKTSFCQTAWCLMRC